MGPSVIHLHTQDSKHACITYGAGVVSNITSMMSFLLFLSAFAISSASDERALSRLNVSSVLNGTPVSQNEQYECLSGLICELSL